MVAARTSASLPAVATLLILTTSTSLRAQNLEFGLDAGVSHARPPSGVTAEPASYLLLGARVFRAPLFASLYAGLGPDANTGSWGSAAVGAFSRTAVARDLDLGVTVVGSAFTVGDPTPYRAALGEVTPELTAHIGTVHTTIRGHGGLGRSEVSDLASGLWSYGGGLEVGGRAARLDLRAGGDAYRSASGAYQTVFASSSGPLARARWMAELRAWNTPGDVELELDLRVQVPLGARWSLDLSGGRSGPDPLLGSPPGVNGGALVSWSPRLGPAPPAPVYEVAGGYVVFRLRRPEAGQVSVVGDFSDWRPVPMVRKGDVWEVRMPVEPGLHHFAFRVNGDWYVPQDAPGQVDDEFGRRDATLIVPGSGDGP